MNRIVMLFLLVPAAIGVHMACADPAKLEAGVWQARTVRVTASDNRPVTNERLEQTICITQNYAENPSLLLFPKPSNPNSGCAWHEETNGNSVTWRSHCRVPARYYDTILTANFDSPRHFTVIHTMDAPLDADPTRTTTKTNF